MICLGESSLSDVPNVFWLTVMVCALTPRVSWRNWRMKRMRQDSTILTNSVEFLKSVKADIPFSFILQSAKVIIKCDTFETILCDFFYKATKWEFLRLFGIRPMRWLSNLCMCAHDVKRPGNEYNCQMIWIAISDHYILENNLTSKKWMKQ